MGEGISVYPPRIVIQGYPPGLNAATGIDHLYAVLAGDQLGKNASRVCSANAHRRWCDDPERVGATAKLNTVGPDPSIIPVITTDIRFSEAEPGILVGSRDHHIGNGNAATGIDVCNNHRVHTGGQPGYRIDRGEIGIDGADRFVFVISRSSRGQYFDRSGGCTTGFVSPASGLQ